MDDLLKAKSMSWAIYLARKTKASAQKRGIKCDIGADDIFNLIAESGGVCALTKLPLDLWDHPSSPDRSRRKTRIRPFIPSIDRIDSNGGYHKSNARIVCAAMNYALGDWGEAVFAALAAGYLGMNASGQPASGELPKGIYRHIDKRTGTQRFAVRIRDGAARKYVGQFATIQKAIAAKAEAEENLKKPSQSPATSTQITHEENFVSVCGAKEETRTLTPCGAGT